MLRAVRDATPRWALVPVLLLLLLAACNDRLKQLRTADKLHGQIEIALRQMEVGRQVPGLRHRHVTVELDPDNDGFVVKIYDLKLGTADIGFQSFSLMSFSLAQTDETHFVGDKFAMMPKPIGKGPMEAVQKLVGLLQRAVSTLNETHD